MTSKSSTVEVVLVLEITPCPLTDMTRDSKDNLQDKGVNHVLKYELLLLPTFNLLFPLYCQLQVTFTFHSSSF